MQLEKILENIDICVALSLSNRYYFSGIKTSFGCVILSREKKYYITDNRYRLYVNENLASWETLFVSSNDFYSAISDCVKKAGGGRIGFEESYVTFEEYQALKDALADCTLEPVSKQLMLLRSVKTDEEIENIKKAQEITEKALSATLDLIKPQMSEKDVLAELMYQTVLAKADGFAFDPIIASGVNAAKPHHIPSAKKIEKDDLILFDFGAKYQGYCSDMSRTVCLGNPSKKLESVYGMVLQAQNYALKGIRAGITAREADSFAREYLTANGFEKEFGHGLGHGVGIDIHEYPRISSSSDVVLQENMVITVEPGVYIDDLGGVRIEDLVVVKKDGIINLTTFSKELSI